MWSLPAARTKCAASNAPRVLRNLRQRRCFSKGAARYQNATSNGVSSQSRRIGYVLAATAGAGGLYLLGYPTTLQAEPAIAQADIKIEPARKKAANSEENRALLSSQHLQVKNSWEHPGVYAWGSNTGRVVAPESEEPTIKTPRRLAYFDGKILRDIKLDREFGAAVLENGDVVQWGIGFSAENPLPLSTLEGKNIIKIAISRDRVMALARNGTVYSLPASRQDQLSGPKPTENTWIPFVSTASPISYLKLTIPNLQWGEQVSDISSGREHTLLLTNTGRLFSAVSASEDYPTRGQLGIPGLAFVTRPPEPFYQPQEIRALQNLCITKIATGDFHSLAFDAPNNRIFAFGDNTAGQLGWEPSVEASAVDSPTPIPINKLYNGTKLIPTITDIAAGGNNTFFTVDAACVPGFGEDPTGTSVGRITADTWACGTGIHGGLGNGRWTHVQGTPVKIKALSGLFEYDERTNQTVPIRLMRLSVGSTHAAAQMSNVTHLDSEERKDPNETNYGADVLVWGANEFYQLGTGRRNNLSTPTYIAPLDPSIDKDIERREEKRFQITPRKEIMVEGRKVEVEQRVECGRGVTAVYSAT